MDIDILIPTSKKRLQKLLWQIRSCFNQGLDVRVTVASTGEYPELLERLTDVERIKMRFIIDAPEGLCGNAASKHAMENYEWGDWFYSIGDDDALLPWGLKHLWNNKQGVDMVIGRALCVSKGQNLDLTQYRVGTVLARGRVSGVCTLFNFRKVEKLGKPYWDADSVVSDWELIEKMAENHKYKIIPETVCVLALGNVQGEKCE
ncbi:MAG: hypothetical protein QME51_09020 [Planctomycetota bacterium]|nr:hypothetical protein [Planctomycetota bacterium]